MRHWRRLLPGLVAFLPLACAGGQAMQTIARMDPLRAFHSTPAPDTVQLDVALVECPVGDGFINRDLWLVTDEQVIGLEHRATLEENGFRVGEVIGLPPTELRTLLKSERSCVNPRRRLLAIGAAAPLQLGPVQAECRFQVHRSGGSVPVALQQAECSLMVVPTATPDGRIRLHFTPKVEHGELLPQFRAAPDRSGWEMKIQRQSETYTDLSWDVVLASNEFLVIGAWLDQPGTLGHQAFVDTEGIAPVQRLLVIRTGRSGAGIDAEIADLPPADPAVTAHSPPLALQATWSARGTGN
jgi:hypothetical protein